MTIQALAKHLRSTRLMNPLTTAQLIVLLDESGIKTARQGDIIVSQEESMIGHLILIEGELEAQRIWSVPGENDKSYTWLVKPIETNNEIGSELAYLGAADRIHARALTDIKYVQVDADKIDELISWDEHFADDLIDDPELRHRMDLIKQVSVFYKMPMENIKEAFMRMQPKEVKAGEIIIEQGDKGDSYYVIETGIGDVIQTDPFTDETKHVTKLGPGDAFGEEALLQDAYRNATVTMSTPGTLLVLAKDDFNSLLRSEVVEEITPDEALALINNNKSQWLDCRYDMEYEESRIPGAPLATLGSIRKDVHQLDPDVTYIVYCRSGRRSRAATYLLKERGIHAMSLKGGIKNWPYEIDAQPLS